MRDYHSEIEMKQIALEVWNKIGNQKMPEIKSKQGGSTGCYYKNEHTVYFRWNSWNKMPLAGKRMITIHELYHARGEDHNSKYMFCHAYDIFTIELYKLIYGEDDELRSQLIELRKYAESIIN